MPGPYPSPFLAKDVIPEEVRGLYLRNVRQSLLRQREWIADCAKQVEEALSEVESLQKEIGKRGSQARSAGRSK
jgi:hypothetical protein